MEQSFYCKSVPVFIEILIVGGFDCGSAVGVEPDFTDVTTQIWFVFDTDLSLYDTGSSQVFLWAHWTQEPQQITNFEVRFYYNGGMLASSQGLEGFEGDYGGKFYQLLSDNAGIATTLPQVTRSEYTFDGWYTAETGGERITTTTVLNLAFG